MIDLGRLIFPKVHYSAHILPMVRLNSILFLTDVPSLINCRNYSMEQNFTKTENECYLSPLFSIKLVRFQVLTVVEYEDQFFGMSPFKSKKQQICLQSQCKVYKYLKLTLMKRNEVHDEIRKVSTGNA
jgi:spore germination protein GerM